MAERVNNYCHAISLFTVAAHHTLDFDTTVTGHTSFKCRRPTCRFKIDKMEILTEHNMRWYNKYFAQYNTAAMPGTGQARLP